MLVKQEYEYAYRLMRMYRLQKNAQLFHDGYLEYMRNFRIYILMAAWNSLSVKGVTALRSNHAEPSID